MHSLVLETKYKHTYVNHHQLFLMESRICGLNCFLDGAQSTGAYFVTHFCFSKAESSSKSHSYAGHTLIALKSFALSAAILACSYPREALGSTSQAEVRVLWK